MGTAYMGLGLYDAAERLLRTAVVIHRKSLGDQHEDTLSTLHALANVHWFQDRYGEAESLYRMVVENRRRQLGDDHRATLTANFDLASAYFGQGRLTEGERLRYRQ